MTGAAKAPAWFTLAVAATPEHVDVTVEDCLVHARCWGAPTLPGLVLVHGGAAHSGWWDHIAPFLAATHRVVAVDLSGHGDSGHRDLYSYAQWARDVVAVIDAQGLRRPVVVGHSMGGWAAVTVAVEHPESVGGVVVVDSPLITEPANEAEIRRRQLPTRLYATREEAVARFRPMPQQPGLLPYVVRHVGEQSVRPVEGGWTWKFDPRRAGQRPPTNALLPRIACRAAVLRGETGLVPDEMAAEMHSLLDARTPVIELPGAGHHPMLDQPLQLVTALRTLLASWAACPDPTTS